MTKNIIFGSGGHGRVVYDLFNERGIDLNFFIDDQPKNDNLDGISVLNSNFIDWQTLGDFRFIVAIGNNRHRGSVFRRLIKLGGSPLTVIHPQAIVSKKAIIAEGTVVMPGVVVNTNAHVGFNCILNTSCSVGHDCRIGDHTHLGPGVRLAGGVRIGNSTFLGVSTCVIPGIMVGAGVICGAGSVVTKSLPNHCCVYGNPAEVQYFLNSSKA